MKGFEQALAVKQVSQNIKSFSYLNLLYRPNQLDRNFRSFWGWFLRWFGLLWLQIAARGWYLVRFCISFAKKVSQIALFWHFSNRLFLVIYTLDCNKTQ